MKIPTKNTTMLTTLALACTIAFSACDDTSTGSGDEPGPSQIETQTVADLAADTASTGAITYYSFQENAIVEVSDSASTAWDIAFSGTTVYTNSGVSGPGEGGAVVLDQAFENTTIAPSEGYNIDTDTLLAIPSGGGNGWYNYTGQNNGNPPQHAILPIENTTIIIRTADGEHYAKLQVISYYKGNPDPSTEMFENLGTRPTSPIYTFEYAIQLNGTRKLN